jgi:exosortase D (VPLPA-CTERM-specific)
MAVQSIDRGTNGETVWRLSWGLSCVALAIGILSVWPFWDGLSVLWDYWVDIPEYSHCLLIPPIAAFLIYQQKDRLETMVFSGSWWGVALLILGGALLVLGQLGTVFTIVQYAYLLSLYGLVLAFLGWPACRLIVVPLLILLFMVPLPSFLFANLSTTLQLLSSQAGVAIIRLFGISVFLEGNVIDLGSYKLQVADACSGLRYLFPLMTMGFLVAYFYKGATWKRLVLFLSSIPISVIMNSIRVGIIGVTVDNWGTAMAEGFLHEFQGWMIFMASVALMLGEVALLNRIGRREGSWRQMFGVEMPAATPAEALVRNRRLPASFVAAAGLLVILIGAVSVIPRPVEIIPVRAAFSEFPMELGRWRGIHQSLDSVYLDQLMMDDYMLADYVDGAGGSMNFYVSWYNSQRKGQAVHTPRACLPGGGWQIQDLAQRTLPGIAVNGQPLRVNRAIIQLGNQRQVIYYWFQQRGRVIDNEFAVKWYLFWDALIRHRTDGAMVRLITLLPTSGTEEAADRRLTEFATLIAPHLDRYVPN